MKTITKTYQVFTYEELSDKAKNKVKEKLREKIINDRFFWFEEDIQYILSYKYNLHDMELNYSLSYCQGDGACFYNKNKNILSYTRMSKKEELNCFEEFILNNYSNEDIKRIIKYLNWGYGIFIKKSSYNYSHGYTCFIDYEYFTSDIEKEEEYINELICKLCDDLYNNVYIKICDEIEQNGYKLYNISEEDIKEVTEQQEMLFLSDGEYYYE